MARCWRGSHLCGPELVEVNTLYAMYPKGKRQWKQVSKQ